MEPDMPNAPAAPSALFNVSTFFNASYFMATRFFGLSSRVLARMRRLDEILDQDYSSGLLDATTFSTSGSSPPRSRRVIRLGTGGENGGASGMNVVPGPWGFLTSGYFIGLFVMGFLLNRIHNIVVPPHDPLLYVRHYRRRRNRGYRILSSLLGCLFPVNMSSTFSRFVFRIPSLYLLGKTLLIWIVVFLQTAKAYPSYEWTWLQNLGTWVQGKTMDDICWFSFTSVCVTMFVGALTSGLEGSSTYASFNLSGYAFNLYLYTSLSLHSTRLNHDKHSRPDKHIILALTFPIAQFLMLHCMEIRKKWAGMRLVPTAIFNLLSLFHFHMVIWTLPSSYPLPNYLPKLAESLLIAITAVTCTLNALTQLLLTGSITKPLIGHTGHLTPKWEEEFFFALFRLGTASLEATSVAGLGNQVGGVSASIPVLSFLKASSEERNQPEVELQRSGVVSYSGSTSTRSGQAKRGFTNEITRVKAGGTTQPDYWVDSVLDSKWRREWTRFGTTLWKVLKGTWILVRGKRQLLEHISEEERSLDRSQGQGSQARSQGDADGSRASSSRVEDDYAKFLRGEDVSDDEGDEDEFSPRSRSQSPPISPLDFSDFENDGAISGDEGEGGEEDDEDDENVGDGEAVGLYADLSATASHSTSAPLLLAHMTSTSASPLTRRRYTALVSQTQEGRTSGNDLWRDLAVERREAKAWKRNEEDDPSRRNCVVCTVEPREIICWPCRCLALCDDCRENMASRSAASKHTCPCCRRSVEGYSKIYTP